MTKKMTSKEKPVAQKEQPEHQAKTAPKTAKKAKTHTTDKEKEKLIESLKACEEKHNALHDKYLRLSAEFDNYRKRTLKEKTEMVKTASEDLLIRIIPFMDDMERGMQVVNQAKELDGVKEGMNLIYSRFRDFLQQNGIKEIDAMHQEFNMDLHEAVTKIPVQDNKLKGKIVDVIEKGYILHDKVIRYPKVVIGE
ncbi:MAG: nucleotide exchange factor GrpE [Bacteroidales bacterium]|nr:nucleotide exchange factor GrpE [Bacteroidales bacterium]